MLRVGMVLYGYCGGAFGRDSYHAKRVEAVGFDWVVVRPVDGGGSGGAVEFASFQYEGWEDWLIKESQTSKAEDRR